METIDDDFACILRGCAGCAPQARLEACCQRLDLHIQALHSLCHRLYGENNQKLCDAACESIRSFQTNNVSLSAELTFKRALLLMAMHLEPEVSTHFCRHGSEATKSGVRRLMATILPKTVRTFITGLCQHPQTFCNQTLLLYELWDEQGHFDAFVEESTDAKPDDELQGLNGLALFPSLQATSTMDGVMNLQDIVTPSDEED